MPCPATVLPLVRLRLTFLAAALSEGSPETVPEGERWPADLVLAGPQGETRYSPGSWTCAS
jgi:hypothetical protein